MAIELGDNIKLGLGLPNDARYFSTTTNKPWACVEDVNSGLTGGVGGVRYTGLTVNIAGVEYWYCGGIGDGDLVPKELGGGGLLNWTGSTSNAVGTYISSSGICAQPNLTFDGTILSVTGNTCVSGIMNIGNPTKTTRDLNVGADGIYNDGNFEMPNDKSFFFGAGALSDSGTRYKLFTINCHAYMDFYDCLIIRSGPISSSDVAYITSGGTICAVTGFVAPALQVTSGAATGCVLTSDASGNATWQSPSGSGSGENVTKLIEQTSHGFDVMDVVGWSGGTYSLAIADGTYDGEILGLVTKCYNADCFDLTQTGYITGLTGLVANSTYFLSDTTEGLLTDTKPTETGHIVKSVIVADDTTSGWVLPYPAYLLSVSSGTTGGSSLNEFTITGDSSTTGFTVNHGLDNQFVMVQVVENTTPYATIYTDVLRPNSSCVCVTFDSPPTNGTQYKILIVS